jgi:micrococcal nuclease
MEYGRRRKLFSSFLLTLLVLAVTVIFTTISNTSWFKNSADNIQQADPGLYTINHYVDGDTIAVNMNGTVETIRFIGVDTPETHKPNTPVQCFGPDAAAYTKQRISQFGKVRLQADPLDTNRDVYGRLLRYVYLPDGTLMDKNIIENGYGFAYLSFPFSKKAEFADAQAAAQAAKKGLWAACQPTVNKYGGYTSNPS